MYDKKKKKISISDNKYIYNRYIYENIYIFIYIYGRFDLYIGTWGNVKIRYKIKNM